MPPRPISRSKRNSPIWPNSEDAADGTRLRLGGTSILIVVGVVVETMKQLEAQLLQRSYEGFIR